LSSIYKRKEGKEEASILLCRGGKELLTKERRRGEKALSFLEKEKEGTVSKERKKFFQRKEKELPHFLSPEGKRGRWGRKERAPLLSSFRKKKEEKENIFFSGGGEREEGKEIKKKQKRKKIRRHSTPSEERGAVRKEV